MDVLELIERGKGMRSWIRIDGLGNSQAIDMDKLSMLHRTGISARDLQILDPLFVYPTTILGRHKAIVTNLERIRCVITAEEVFLLNSLDSNVLKYVMELQKRLRSKELAQLNRSNNSTTNNPFEFVALAVALDVAARSLDSEASELKTEAYPLLDELTTQISNRKLERVRELKSKLVALTRRTYKLREEIEKTMDDGKDMAEMHLTEKKRKMGSNNNHHHVGIISETDNNIKTSVEELESLLQAYFVVIDSILNKLITMKEYVQDTENFINIKMNNLRNRLIQFELLMTSATFVLAIFGIVIGIFGINFPTPLFDNGHTIKLILIITSVCGLFIYFAIVCFFKLRVLVL